MNAWCTGLYIDSFPRDFSAPNPYRGQNANMHMCEAQIALFEALGTPMHLERATAIAHKLCVALPVSAAAPFASSSPQRSGCTDRRRLLRPCLRALHL